MEECTEMLSSEESHVFFYQDIFKLSFKVGSLPLMSLSHAVQKHLTTPMVPQHRQTGQEKVPDSLVHRLIKVHSGQPDDSLLLWHSMKFFCITSENMYLYPHYENKILTQEGVQATAGGSEDVNYVPNKDSWYTTCLEPMRN